MIVLIVLIVGGGFVALMALLIGAALRSARERAAAQAAMLAELARGLGGTSTGNGASGTHRGVATALSFTTTGSGSTVQQWTDVTCALPRGYPFTLHLERHGFFDRGAIERGEMTDVVVGDPAFDDAFRIEGAPAEVVRRVLVPDVRRALLAYGRPTIQTSTGDLCLRVNGWLEDLTAARAAIDCAATIAAGVRDASLALDAAVPLVHDGPAYRSVVSDAPLQEARAARAAEVAGVARTRLARLQAHNRWAVVGLVTFAAFLVIMIGGVIAVLLGAR